MASSPPNRNYAFASALIDEFSRCGVEHACICPGSRSTPLALSFGDHKAIESHVQIDERSAGFFALGLAKASRSPVALVCTSGTAAANFYPAVIEAYYTGVPLLVLTADRPPELRDWGAGQTIDQHALYGSHVRWFCEVPVPTQDASMLRYARALGCRAVDAAVARPSGPIHLNLPFREPLDPREVEADIAAAVGGSGRDGRVADAPYTRIRHAGGAPTPDDAARVTEILEHAKRPVITVGPLDASPDAAPAIAELASLLGCPLLAEPASQLRSGPYLSNTPVIAASDLFLRGDGFANAHMPDVVLRFGTAPSSKAQRLWLEKHPPTHFILVDPEERFQDPSHLATDILRVDEVALCEHLCRRLPEAQATSSAWLHAFQEADASARQVLDKVASDDTLLEARVVLEFAKSLPDQTRLLVSNSMPIRYVDALWPASETPLRVFSHRGANGIDGLVSSAVGIASDRSPNPVVLLTGDLAFLHDVSGLIAAKRLGTSLTIVVLDNDGGGIFSHLPVATSGPKEAFETFFRTRHASDLAALASGIGANAARVTSLDDFRKTLASAFNCDGLSVVIVPVDRDESLLQFRSIVSNVAEATKRAS